MASVWTDGTRHSPSTSTRSTNEFPGKLRTQVSRLLDIDHTRAERLLCIIRHRLKYIRVVWVTRPDLPGVFPVEVYARSHVLFDGTARGFRARPVYNIICTQRGPPATCRLSSSAYESPKRRTTKVL